MEQQQNVIKFRIDNQLFAAPIEQIVQIIRAVEVTHVPNAPKSILGVINYHGAILPVLDLRFCLALPLKDIEPDNRIIIVDTGIRKIALVVDEVTDLLAVSDDNSVKSDDLLHEPELKRMVRTNNNIIFIYDFELILKNRDGDQLHKLIEESENQSHQK